MTTEIQRRRGIAAGIFAWVGARQRELSDRVHAAGDAAAGQHGWTVTAATGQFGFGARSYRDPRFDDRRRQLSSPVALGPTSIWMGKGPADRPMPSRTASAQPPKRQPPAALTLRSQITDYWIGNSYGR
jgi:hypothetical protein